MDFNLAESPSCLPLTHGYYLYSGLRGLVFFLFGHILFSAFDQSVVRGTFCMCRLLRFVLYGYVSAENIFPTGWIFIVTIVTL